MKSKKILRILSLITLLFFVFIFSSCDLISTNPEPQEPVEKNYHEIYTYDASDTKSYYSVGDILDKSEEIKEDEHYVSYFEVCVYIFMYHKLPSNYIKKEDAKSLGWKGSGYLWVNDRLNGMVIGGDSFYNREGYLPYFATTVYVELDVDTYDGTRGSCRIVYNTKTFDIYYTSDHYNSFRYLIGDYDE